jgi:transcriptional regulator of acetoin/glycerol metabolism
MAESTTISEGPAGGQPGAALAAHLYVALDCTAPTAPPRRLSLAGVDVVRLGRGEGPVASRVVEAGERRLVVRLPDRWMSGQHARLFRALGRWLIEDLASRNGVRVNGEATQRMELEDGDVIELGRTFLVLRESQPAGPLEVVGEAGVRTLLPDLETRFAQLAPLCRAGVPVMVSGEPGVGKELAARLVHELSGRRGAFIPVNCGALPSELVASQLFGHQRGAFTGASEDRQGFVRAAHQGTLFLDEVGELPLLAQPTLLRVLQEREVTPVGATRPSPVDLQLVTATNRDLPLLVREQRFRADLLSRLSGFQITLPPLRERREDLGLIIAGLLRRLDAPGLSFTPEAARALFTSAWPMNIRELEKALQVGAALAQGKVVELAHLPQSVLSSPTPPPAAPLDPADEALRLQLVAQLEEHQGNISAVARASGKARMQVQRWLKRFGLDPRKFRPPG